MKSELKCLAPLLRLLLRQLSFLPSSFHFVLWNEWEWNWNWSPLSACASSLFRWFHFHQSLTALDFSFTTSLMSLLPLIPAIHYIHCLHDLPSLTFHYIQCFANAVLLAPYFTCHSFPSMYSVHYWLRFPCSPLITVALTSLHSVYQLLLKVSPR